MPFLQFRVHPGVGCARMGNSENAYHLASEFPQFMQEEFPQLRFKPKPRRHPKEFFNGDETGLTAQGDLATFSIYRSPQFQTKYFNKFKEDVGVIFPQGARFRVFAYIYANDGSTHPDTVFEVTTEVADIEWKVNIANKKSRKITAIPEETSPNMTAIPSDLDTAGGALICKRVLPVVGLPTLGYVFLERDDADKSKVTGRLHVIGNEGDMHVLQILGEDGQMHPTPVTSLWSNNWYDSAGDGSVEATIKPKGDGGLLRAKAGAASAADLKYLEYGVDAPQPGSASTIRALPGWVVVGVPDYVPDMGHFVSLWDLALSRCIYGLDARGAQVQIEKHNLIVLRNKIESYLTMDYLVHIHPQLCLFEDVRYVSGEAYGDPAHFDTQDRGHNLQPLHPPPPTPAPGEDNDVTMTRKVEHGGVFIHARSRKAELADETTLKDPDRKKPIADWLKVAVYQRLRLPGTLYDKQRQFIVDPPVGDEGRQWGVFPRKLGRRMDFDKPQQPGSDKAVLYDAFNYEYPPGNLRRFHGLEDKGQLCGKVKAPPTAGPSGLSLTAEEKKLLDSLDDMYWPASFSDMPMLRELAFTPLQHDQFFLWQSIDSMPLSGKLVDDNVRSANIFDQIVSPGLKTSFAAQDDADKHFADFLAARPKFAPAMIDMAHMGAMVGGSFLPGIEVGREAGIATNWCLFHGGTTHFPDIRFKPCNDNNEHTVGTLTKDLGVPWTEDFKDCDETFWPTARPGMIFLTASESDRHYWMLHPKVESTVPAERQDGDVIPHLGHVTMGEEYFREYWKSLGFVRRTSNDDFVVAE